MQIVMIKFLNFLILINKCLYFDIETINSLDYLDELIIKYLFMFYIILLKYSQ